MQHNKIENLRKLLRRKKSNKVAPTYHNLDYNTMLEHPLFQ